MTTLLKVLFRSQKPTAASKMQIMDSLLAITTTDTMYI